MSLSISCTGTASLLKVAGNGGTHNNITLNGDVPFNPCICLLRLRSGAVRMYTNSPDTLKKNEAI